MVITRTKLLLKRFPSLVRHESREFLQKEDFWCQIAMRSQSEIQIRVSFPIVDRFPSGASLKNDTTDRAIRVFAINGTGKRGHYERGLFTGEISRISKFSRISRRWLDSPCFPRVWGFSSISRISKISRNWTFLKRPLFQKTPFFRNRDHNRDRNFDREIRCTKLRVVLLGCLEAFGVARSTLLYRRGSYSAKGHVSAF